MTVQSWEASEISAGWETDMSSQTSASQGGILLGSNHNIPAFRWYDRSAKELRSSSDPKFLAGLEKTLSSGDGLLVDDGASRGNLFSGDAPDVMVTASTMLDKSRFHTVDFQAYFLNPYHLSRTLMLTSGATFKQRYSQSLEELVRGLATEKYVVRSDAHVHEEWKQVNALLTETVQYGQGAIQKPLSAALRTSRSCFIRPRCRCLTSH